MFCCCYQIDLIEKNNGGCYGLHYHLSNNGVYIFKILIRGDLQKCTFVGTIRFDIIQDTKRYFENNSDSHSWYDNLLSQCFADYEKS